MIDEMEDVYVVSSASMNIFPNNTLSSFRNRLQHSYDFEGNWRVALSVITFPATVSTVTNESIFVGDGILGDHGNNNADGDEMEVDEPIIDGSEWTLTIEDGEEWPPRVLKSITPGVYNSVDSILEELKRASEIDLDYSLNAATGKLTLSFPYGRDSITFKDREIPNILGFNGVHDDKLPDYEKSVIWNDAIHIGFRQLPIVTGTHAWKPFQITGDYPVDITAGKQLIFVYLNIIEYQSVGDTKAQLLRVFSRNIRLRNGSIQPIEAQTTIAFRELEYKKLLSRHIQSIQVQLKTETGQLVPFFGTGQTVLTLKFKKFS